MDLFENEYPGNAAVMERLLSALSDDGITAFTGAGTSMPSLPGWGSLVTTLIDDAAKDGRLDSNTATALRDEHSDYLYVVDEIYAAAGRAQTKAKVSKLFSSLDKPTEAHELIVGTQFERLMTLNYDNGLETAFAQKRFCHVASITARQSNEVDEWLRNGASEGPTQVLHWHGLAGNAETIVLSSSDYVDFYDSDPVNNEVLRNIFKTQRVLMIGFGFSDPFVERQLNSVMQPIQTANSHFAIVGLPEGKAQNIQLERRKYATKYKLETIFYPVRTAPDGRSDHSALNVILSSLSTLRSRDGTAVAVAGGTAVALVSTPAYTSYRASLFTIGNRQIYCEPNIWSSTVGADGAVEKKVSFTELMTNRDHVCLEAPHEFGLSNVGKRLAGDMAVAGEKVIFRDAQGFPKYKKAILSDPDFANIGLTDQFTVVLDNFFIVEHLRAVRELLTTFENVRVIVLQLANVVNAADSSLFELNFRQYQLRGLSRSDIRGVISIIAPTYNSDIVSTIVDKVYCDLLQLCIPLTPSNVIMYASVLCKDGTFSPVSRLHIVDRFVAEALQRASDAYADTFNSVHKIDLLAAFCYDLFSKDKSTFTELEWRSFCDRYKIDNLVEFGQTEILGDLYNGRIVIREGQEYYFRYRMFFSYFVGRHISSNPSLLQDCLQQNRHLELDGLIEVLCGTLSDCSDVLEDLTSKLSASLEKFYSEYPIGGLDFHQAVKWELQASDEALWESVDKRIGSGPTSTEELDALKTSIQAERRTNDQKVSIIKFIASEQSVTLQGNYLTTALESAKQANARAKKAAARAVINGYSLAYEVASVFTPLIAVNKYVSWSGFTYINLIEDDLASGPDESANKDRMERMVISALPSSVSDNVADWFGSRKLGPVFSALVGDEFLTSSFKRFLLLCLLARSKPVGWLKVAKTMVAEMDREDLYLRHIINAAVREFREEINTEAERQDLKELVAAVKLRREVKIKNPSPTELKRVIGILDAGGFFEKKADLPKV